MHVRKDPGQPGAALHEPDEVLALAERARDAGCKEALSVWETNRSEFFRKPEDFLRQQAFPAPGLCGRNVRLSPGAHWLAAPCNPGVMDRLRWNASGSNASVGLMLEQSARD